MEKLKSLFKERAALIDITLNDDDIEKFFLYKDILKEWNQKINLTAIEDDEGIIIKHFIDSMTILPYLEKEEARIIDVGTGAGFPGIPIKILRSDVIVTLLDSLDKRIKFLDNVNQSLGLTGIETVHGRAEDFGMKTGFRESFDVAVARAVASLPVLLEYCLPFVKVGGHFIAMKGSSAEEVAQSKKALDILGGQIQDVKEFVIPGTDMNRSIVIVKKLRQTPTKYPRKAGKPTKEPLI
jgi:16S rRNA (guanine(527)-N(7))-methyltransferase GidB